MLIMLKYWYLGREVFLFDNIVEADLDLLKRLSTSDAYSDLKNSFFEAIIGQRTA